MGPAHTQVHAAFTRERADLRVQRGVAALLAGQQGEVLATVGHHRHRPIREARPQALGIAGDPRNDGVERIRITAHHREEDPGRRFVEG